MLRLKTPLEVRCMAILYVYMASSTKISRRMATLYAYSVGVEHLHICLYEYIIFIYTYNIERMWLRNVYGVKYEKG